MQIYHLSTPITTLRNPVFSMKEVGQQKKKEADKWTNKIELKRVEL